MSYWPQKYGDPETVENIDYEKVEPPYFEKYFSQDASSPNVSRQLSPDEQPYFEKYFEPVSKLKKGLGHNKKTSTESRSGYEQYVERPAQIAGSAAVQGVKALPRTVFDLSEALLRAVGGKPNEGDIAQFKNIFPSFEEFTKRQEGIAIPENSFEKGVQKFGRFAGETASTFGLGGVRGAVGLGGAAAGAQTAEEIDANLPGSIALTLAGDIVARRATGIAEMTYKALTNPKSALANSFMFKKSHLRR